MAVEKNDLETVNLLLSNKTIDINNIQIQKLIIIHIILIQNILMMFKNLEFNTI